MSYSLAIANGDLVQTGDSMGLVFGLDKLNQDMYLWIMERYGGDRFHVNMGSILQEFIGGVVGPDTTAEVQAEIFRILQNYQALQLRLLKEKPTWLSTSEMLVAVDSVTAQASYDTVNVAMKLRNGSGNSATITLATSTT